MANSREVKLIEKEFLELSKENENNFFLVKNNEKSLDVKRRQKTSKNLSDFSKNFYEKNLNGEFFLELKEDSNLEFSGNGILYIKILDDIDWN